MESTKGVIRIIKKATNSNDYDEYYYFTDVATDINNHLMARVSGNIWDAMKFIYVYTNDDEYRRIKSLMEFIKTCFTPRKNYIIEFIPVTLNYN